MSHFFFEYKFEPALLTWTAVRLIQPRQGSQQPWAESLALRPKDYGFTARSFCTLKCALQSRGRHLEPSGPKSQHFGDVHSPC